MAARNSSRGARRRGRLAGNRPRTHPPRSAAERPAAEGPSAIEVLIREIRLLALRLEVIYRTAVTVEMALRYQNTDQDVDLADCLRHAVCEAIWDESEKAHGLSKRLQPCAGARSLAWPSRIMSAGKRKRRTETPQRPAIALAQHVNLERDRLFKAMSIIACCRLACASLLDQGGNLEMMGDALQAAYDLVDGTAGGLEVIGAGAVTRRIGGK